MGTPHPLRSLALANHPLPQRQRATVPVRPRHESALLLRLASQRVRDSVEREPTVSRTNVLYLVIGALAVAVAVLSYQLYQDRHQPKGVHIDVGPGGLSIQGK
jgi:hypothetical protein